MTNAPSVLFGVPIDGYTMTQALERIGELVDRGRKVGRTHHVTTVNVDFLVNAIDDAEVMRILQNADLNLADGMPLIWASRLLGTPLPERVTGADLVPRLATASAEHGWALHLLGAAPTVAERARSVMLEENPGAWITADCGPSNLDVSVVDEQIVNTIRELDPDVLCVALGNPKQERFVATYRDVLRCPVMIGIGGSLDMLVGDKHRAPSWAQRVGAEWIFRAAQEPKRLGKRYAHDIAVFGPRLHGYAGTVRKYRTTTPLGIESDGQHLVIRTGISEIRWADLSLAELASIEVRLTGLDELAPPDHAQLVSLARNARVLDVPLTISGASAMLRECLSSYRTWPILAGVLSEL
jgi:exopolysaccharide biosynthesis WecB/TagA/CpsF family protein